jgi:hypothetical protein
MQAKTAKQAKQRATRARLKLVRLRARPIIGRERDLGDVRLQFLLGASNAFTSSVSAAPG